MKHMLRLVECQQLKNSPQTCSSVCNWRTLQDHVISYFSLSVGGESYTADHPPELQLIVPWTDKYFSSLVSSSFPTVCVHNGMTRSIPIVFWILDLQWLGLGWQVLFALTPVTAMDLFACNALRWMQTKLSLNRPVAEVEGLLRFVATPRCVQGYSLLRGPNPSAGAGCLDHSKTVLCHLLQLDFSQAVGSAVHDTLSCIGDEDFWGKKTEECLDISVVNGRHLSNPSLSWKWASEVWFSKEICWKVRRPYHLVLDSRQPSVSSPPWSCCLQKCR